MDVSAMELIEEFRQRFPKEYELVVLTIQNRKLSEELAEKSARLESLTAEEPEPHH